MESVHAISSYVAYRVENSVDPSPWIALLESFETDVGGDALAEQFRGIIAAADKVPISDRLAAIGQLPIVDGLHELGQWLATSKPVTTSQVPRQIRYPTPCRDARYPGCRCFSKTEPQDEPTVFEDLMASSSTAPDPQMPYIPNRTTTYSVQSALEIPELMSWWTALETLQVIELTASSQARASC